jgi:hypothetical protein
LRSSRRRGFKVWCINGSVQRETVEARIEMLAPVVELSEPQPQGAEPTTFAHEHDGCNMQPTQPAHPAQFLQACRQIDETPRQFQG